MRSFTLYINGYDHNRLAVEADRTVIDMDVESAADLTKALLSDLDRGDARKGQTATKVQRLAHDAWIYGAASLTTGRTKSQVMLTLIAEGV